MSCTGSCGKPDSPESYCSRGGRTSNKRMNISAGVSVSEAPVSFSYNIVYKYVTIRALLFI